MDILFVLPGIGKKKGEKYLKSWLMEPLTIAVLSKLTPAKYGRVFLDDRIEIVDENTPCDAVAITVETYTAKRAYELAERFRRQGKIVIMGGYHVTLCPEDAAEHADVVIIGNAEGIWAGVLADIENGSFKPLYRGETAPAYGLPDRSIYADKMKKYLPVSLIEIGRGCTRKCEFCSISSYYGGRYRHRPIEDIVAEIKTCEHRIFFFVDDSIFSDKPFAEELFTEVAKLNITWTTQITLDIAGDRELLRLMRKSGCKLVLIGFESIDARNLRQMNKEWNAKLGERDELVERIHKAGINIYASFVFGFDHDREQSFAEVLRFSMRHKFFVVAFNHLLCFPGTKTYETFKSEGRLLHARWWLQKDYEYGQISFAPALVTPGELRDLCGRHKREYFTLRSIFGRLPTLFSRTKKPMLHLAYWAMNLLFHFEVDKRIGIPVGENLDEAKK
ncbi:MAG: B12-binding domain-containing radical SAM protein [Clostridiales Family XIII bacterium]|nr:B12-binding domain-containing radical SAM protein [Clostridiales Family XIII bacterium]